MNNLPENFDMVYDFINENLDELQKLSDVDRQIAIYWLKKYSDFQVNFVESN